MQPYATEFEICDFMRRYEPCKQRQCNKLNVELKWSISAVHVNSCSATLFRFEEKENQSIDRTLQEALHSWTFRVKSESSFMLQGHFQVGEVTSPI